jgi:hypothetical protein
MSDVPPSDAAKRTLRTVVQTLVGLCVLLPSAIGSAGLTDTLPWAAGAVAVAGGLSRVMAVPGVQAVLPSWLRTGADVNSDQAPRKLPEPAAVPEPAAAQAAAPAAADFGFSAAAGGAAGPGSGSGTAPGPGEKDSGA